MPNKRIRTKKVPSNLPYVVVGIWWAIGTLVLPMYRLSSYLLLAGIGIGMVLIMRKLHVFKDTEIQYEEEIPFEEMELEDVLAEGYGYLADLQKSNEKIADEQMTRGIEEVV
ncbi:MAG: hypothetical protein HUJ58_06745, partial [Erysipelotrichaceae bacterium]|nr:hypothetical protein [Erysipelotrichaceae bacterium]